MAKKKRKKIKYPIFVFSLVIGLGLVAVGFVQPDVIFGGQTLDITGLGILTVPIDPTDAILGTIVLGAPDIMPIEQSGTHISTIESTCTENFGRRLSNERNLDPVWWAKRAGVTCAYAYAQWDLAEIPNEFIATSVLFQLELVETTPASLNCLITFNTFDIDSVPEADLITKLRSQPQLILEGRPSTFPNTPAFVQDPNGTWCRTLNVKTFNFGQAGVDFVNNAIAGSPTEKLVLGFVPSDLDRTDAFSAQYRIDSQFWATQGSWLITGSSPPLTCATGFELQGFTCVPLPCLTGQQFNSTSNQCEQIICASDEELIGSICTPLNCQVGEEIIAGVCVAISCPSTQQLVASSCVDLICDVGFEAKNNVCSLIQCSTGMELINDQCQAIQCPTNTILVGNDCMAQSCPAGQFLVNNICEDEDPPVITCDVGFNKIGNLCFKEELVCPVGTEKFENICVQRFPSLLGLSGEGFVTPQAFVIAGGIVTIMSIVGIIIRRI